MYNVVEYIATYCPMTSADLGYMAILVATYPSIETAVAEAIVLRRQKEPSYEPGEYVVGIEGVKSDINVRCQGDHWSKVELDNAHNGCPEQPWYHSCATVDDPTD